MLLQNASNTISRYLILFMILNKNVLFCKNVNDEYSYDDDKHEGITKSYDNGSRDNDNRSKNYDDGSGDYDEEYNTSDDTDPDNDDENAKDKLEIVSTLSPQQERKLKLFSDTLNQELHLDQKSNFPNSKNITFPPNEYEVEKRFAVITQLNNTNDGSGNYYSNFDTGNYGGVKIGELKDENQVIKGHYTEKFKHNLSGFPPIDVIRNVGYIADEKGYQPFIINYGIDDHHSDTYPQHSLPFFDKKRVPKEYKSHYKPLELYKNVKLPAISKKPLVKDDAGNYNFGFDTLTYKRAESAETINQNTENESRVVKGQYYNIIGGGVLYAKQTIGYTADENGFQPFLISYQSIHGGPVYEIPKHDYYNSERLAEDVSIHFKSLEEYKDVKLPTLGNQNQNKSSDGYQFSFNSDTYNRSEVSETKNKGTENETLIIKGQYTEKIKNEFGEDVIRKIGYVADERGYQPFIIESYIENATAPPYIPYTIPPAGAPAPVGVPRGQSIGSSYVAGAIGQFG